MQSDPLSSLVLLEDKSKANRELSSPLPAKKKAKSERGSIKAFFQEKKPSDQKENRPNSDGSNGPQEDQLIKKLNRTTRRSKTKREEPVFLATENNFISSVHVEKTSLILFDEVSS